MSGYLSTRQSVLYRLAPLTLSRISVGFALIAALWLVVASVHGEIIALVAAAAVFVCAHFGRVLAGQRSPVIVEWGLAGYGMFAEFVVYAGIAAAAGLHPRRPARAGREARSAVRSWQVLAARAPPGYGGWRSSRPFSRY